MFLTQETERQTPHFGNGFLTEKEKTMKKKRENNQKSPPGFEL